MNEPAGTAKTRPFLVVGFCALVLVAALPVLAVALIVLGGFIFVAPFIVVQYLLWGRWLGKDLARARAAEAARAWLEEMDRAALGTDNDAVSESLIAPTDIALPFSSESGIRRKQWTF
jgi:hypothetical protein